ncbi:MAG: helix-turn-helix domain-containing protein [Thermonemataceae bacterium]|nr:helix-turn-helix domain-containing protein [Thermonemataceae bacterium]
MEAQIYFLQYIKKILAPNVSLVDELAEILAMSNDSIYRRLRGETALSLEETFKIAAHYHISIDSLFKISSSEKFTYFSYKPIHTEQDLLKYLQMIEEDISIIAQHKGQMIYAATDLPIFYNFAYPELAAFKLYAWKRYAQVNNQKPDLFTFDKLDADWWKLCQNIYKLYQNISSVEIWTNQTIDSTIQQINYYNDLALFENPTDAKKLVEQLIILIEHIKQKTFLNHQPFSLYQSEVTLDNNCIMTEIQGQKKVYLRHQNLNVLVTKDDIFCEDTSAGLNTIIGKSVLLSGSSERIRHLFFQDILKKCETLHKKIS